MSKRKNEWIKIKNKSVYRFKFNHTMYSAQELIDRFEKTGFCDIQVFGSLTGDSYDVNSNRLIVMGRKPV